MPANNDSDKWYPVAIRRNLHETSRFLDKDTKRRLGVYLDGVYAYLQDPFVAANDLEKGIKELEVRWEPNMASGPTSARFVVVDYNGDTGTLIPPAKWRSQKYCFAGPKQEPLDLNHRHLPQFHQVNVWAVAQRVLDIYESPKALGRPIPWSFGSGKLILVPHAGYDENAYYDRHSKSLQFYYFGEEKSPRYTCLSHDIIAHEMGHAVLDGIRPYYYNYTSIETGAFHESIADLTAIVSAILNNDTRQEASEITEGDLTVENAVALLAEEFGEVVEQESALRNANNPLTMAQVANATTPHEISKVLTGAMFEILASIGNRHLQRGKKTTPKLALWWAADRFQRLVLQPLDFCPPVDIQFADYARAVLTNFLLYEPYDSRSREFYFTEMLRIFRKRGILGSSPFKPNEQPRLAIYHDVNRISRSRTAAYYFLQDNRGKLEIPDKADFEVVDLYDTDKHGREAVRLPREIVLQYIWREEVPLEEEPFGRLQGERAELLCGGTLVMDGRGNILSLVTKGGTAGDKDPQRAAELKKHIANLRSFGLRGEDEAASVLGPWTPAVIGDWQDGLLRLEMAPHLRSPLPTAESGLYEDRSEEQWTSSY